MTKITIFPNFGDWSKISYRAPYHQNLHPEMIGRNQKQY